MKIELIKINEIKIDDSNPNVMPRAKMEALIESIRKFGELQPIIIDKENLIIDGQHRFLAYKELNKIHIPAIRVNLERITDKKLLRQLLNKIKGFHDEIKDSAEFRAILHDYKLEELSLMLGDSEQEIIKILNAMSEQEKQKVEFEASTNQGPQQITFIIDRDRINLIEEALRITGMKDRNNALYEICKIYMGKGK